MSTILKALRRLEEDGRAEEFVDLAERVVQAPAVRSPSMGLVALVAAALRSRCRCNLWISQLFGRS